MSSNNCNNNFNEFGQETFNRFNDLGHHVVGSLFEMALPIVNNLSRTNLNNPINKPEWYPFSDVKETYNSIKIFMSIPGVKKEDIDVTLNNGIINVCATTSINVEEWCHIKERTYKRTFKIPENITQTNLDIKYENGILKIKCNKKNTNNHSGDKIPVN